MPHRSSTSRLLLLANFANKETEIEGTTIVKEWQVNKIKTIKMMIIILPSSLSSCLPSLYFFLFSPLSLFHFFFFFLFLHLPFPSLPLFFLFLLFLPTFFLLPSFPFIILISPPSFPLPVPLPSPFLFPSLPSSLFSPSPICCVYTLGQVSRIPVE